jgi:hypothetical protein
LVVAAGVTAPAADSALSVSDLQENNKKNFFSSNFCLLLLL